MIKSVTFLVVACDSFFDHDLRIWLSIDPQFDRVCPKLTSSLNYYLFLYRCGGTGTTTNHNTTKTSLNVSVTSVAEPDPYVFGPPGSRSGSIGTRYGSGGSESFYDHAK